MFVDHISPPDQQRIDRANEVLDFARIRELVKHVAHRVEPCALLTVGLDHCPRRIRGVGVEEDRFLGTGVVVPFVQGGEVNWAEFPLLERVRLTFLEASALLRPADRVPEFDQLYTAAHEVAFELRRLPHELRILVIGAEAHHALDTGPVEPGSVKQHDLASGGQVLDVALEIPLAKLGLRRFIQGNHARAARVEMLHEALDRAALAGRIAPLEQDHDPLSGGPDPLLQFQQLDLEPVFLLLIVLPAHQVLVGVAAFAPPFGKLVVGLDSGPEGGGKLVLEQHPPQHSQIVRRSALEYRAELVGQLVDVLPGGCADDVLQRDRLCIAGAGDRLAGFETLYAVGCLVRRDVSFLHRTRATRRALRAFRGTVPRARVRIPHLTLNKRIP